MTFYLDKSFIRIITRVAAKENVRSWEKLKYLVIIIT